ncbi:unnamed protein product [Prorocentrum cordatum]|uniref:Uncharacterized protein n=1 Tax=Prorocentrum cordatum TaxID=2364126 RepID=A0ABN9TPB7_9DINO|nr:unnamed protein product [Polarella glacialis]
MFRALVWVWLTMCGLCYYCFCQRQPAGGRARPDPSSSSEGVLVLGERRRGALARVSRGCPAPLPPRLLVQVVVPPGLAGRVSRAPEARQMSNRAPESVTPHARGRRSCNTGLL